MLFPVTRAGDWLAGAHPSPGTLSVIEVMDSPYFRAAEGHGLDGFTLLFRHALPAAANPLISLLGTSIAALLSTSLLIEVIMSWPGMGPLFLESIQSRDLFVVVGSRHVYHRVPPGR